MKSLAALEYAARVKVRSLRYLSESDGVGQDAAIEAIRAIVNEAKDLQALLSEAREVLSALVVKWQNNTKDSVVGQDIVYDYWDRAMDECRDDLETAIARLGLAKLPKGDAS